MKTKFNKEEKEQHARQSFENAVSSQSLKNDAITISAFVHRGYKPEDVQPRINVFTYGAWNYLGRQVKKGEKSISVTVFIPTEDKKTKQKKAFPRTAHLFHIDQTEPIAGREDEYEIKIEAVKEFMCGDSEAEE